MTNVTLRMAGTGTTTVTAATLDALRGEVRGQICLPGEPDYDKSRAIWNGMIDRRPGLVIRAVGAADVMRTVRFAKEHGLLLSVRGGGHNIAGNAVCDGGLLLDLTPMKSVRVDPVAQTAVVAPGVTLGEFDREAQAFGLATPLGINSTTGVAGLTLGGGFGWLSRRYGLTIDNLLSADVVTADGALLRASADENPDLFWAIRGGGGNFGVVTSFEFRLHRVGPQVLSGLIVHPFKEAKALLQGYRRIVTAAPDELSCWIVIRKAPPLPFLPVEVHGKEVVVLAICWCGDLDAGQDAVAPIRALGQPFADVVGPHPYTGWQAAFDPLLAAGARNYWKSHDFLDLGDSTIDAVLEACGHLPSPDCEVLVGYLSGAVNRVEPTATAYPHREMNFFMNVHTRWDDSSQDQSCIAWARALFEKTAAHATGGVYVNFMPEDEAQRVPQGAYGPNYERLSKLKARFDPTNLFRMNQNIRPGS